MSEYFKSDGQYIYLEKPYCEFYIPMKYFENVAGFATDLGTIIKALGVFDVSFFKDNKVTEQKVLNVPSWITITYMILKYEV